MGNWNLHFDSLSYLIIKFISNEKEYLICLIEAGDGAFNLAELPQRVA